MYTFFDTETTGLHNNAEIAQFAALLFDDKRELVGEFCSYVKPDGWTMPEETAKFHGITQDLLERYGVAIEGIFALFGKWCAMSQFLGAHNIQYDVQRVVYTASRKQLKLEMPTSLICSMKDATDIVCLPPTEKMCKAGRGNQHKPPNLQEAHTFFFGAPFEGAHDALADVRASARIAFEIMDRKERAAA